jgi:hypothetical protein
MKKLHTSLGATLAALLVTSVTSFAAASSHREAPAISNDPAADNTDLYAWVEGSNLVILANYIPLEEPAGGPNFHSFSDDVLYEVKLARGGADLDADLTYQIRFTKTPFAIKDPNASPPIAAPAGGLEFFSQLTGQTQSYTVTKVTNGQATVLVAGGKVAPANIGPRTNAHRLRHPRGQDLRAVLRRRRGHERDHPARQRRGPRLRGPRDDGFYVDLGARLRPRRPALPSINNPAYGAKQKTVDQRRRLQHPHDRPRDPAHGGQRRRRRPGSPDDRADRRRLGLREPPQMTILKPKARPRHARPVASGLAPRAAAHQRGGHRPAGQGPLEPPHAQGRPRELRGLLPEPGRSCVTRSSWASTPRAATACSPRCRPSPAGPRRSEDQPPRHRRRDQPQGLPELAHHIHRSRRSGDVLRVDLGHRPRASPTGG